MAVLALIVANTIWGAGPPLFKLALQNINPFTLAFFRFGIASFVIFPFAYKHLFVRKHDIAEVFLAGFLGAFINIAAFFIGLRFAPSINASIISSAGPIFLILASFVFLGEGLRKKLVIGAFVGLMGILLIIFEPIFTSEPNLDFFGNMMFFVAMLGSLGHTIIGRELVKKYNPVGITFWTFIIAALCFAPLAINENLHTSFLSTINFTVIFAIVFGALFSSTAAYFLLFWALKYMPAAETGVFLYLDPIATVIVAFLLLGEKPDAFYIIGSLFVFLGIYIAEGRLHWHPLHLLKGSTQ